MNDVPIIVKVLLKGIFLVVRFRSRTISLVNPKALKPHAVYVDYCNVGSKACLPPSVVKAESSVIHMEDLVVLLSSFV